MGKTKRYKLKADEFIDTFAEHLDLLLSFIRVYNKEAFPNEEEFSLEAFKDIISKAATDDPVMFEYIRQAYDMFKDPYGHETLCAVIVDKKWEVDHSLPVECLAIWLHNKDQEIFNFAYTRMQVNHFDKATMYRSDPIADFESEERNLTEFSNRLKTEFLCDKDSSNVTAREYKEHDCINIIIYHEKRTKSYLVFKGRKNVIGPQVLRPIKQDFISFNYKTGELHVEARFPKEKLILRKAFAKGYLKKEELFESPKASRVFDLNVIADPEFSMPVTDTDHVATLTELKFTMPAETNPTLTIRSENVLVALKDIGLRQQINGASVASARIHLKMGNTQSDKKTIQISGSNSIKYNMSSHKDDVETYLRNWGIQLANKPTQNPI